MAMLEDLITSIELWLKLVKKQQPLVNPNLDPVLLVPGIAGSILNAVDENGKEERVWVRILGADHEFREKLWSQFDPSTGRIVGQDGVCYYHDMIEEMIKWGYQEGKTLFGFGYDFRQSNRLQETLDMFAAKLESVYVSSGGKKMNIITHSMGGLLVKCFMSLYSDIFEKYVKSWIAIAAPFQGAPGYITTSLLNGMSFVEGWLQNFFISKWSMQQLLIECPSIYELMACPNFHWEVLPVLQLWTEKVDGSGTLLESYGPMESITLMNEALANNMVAYCGTQVTLPLNMEILKWANETCEILSRAKLPETVKFYNIYGIHNDTPHCVCYGSQESPITDMGQLLSTQAKYICVNGDGTVPVESAKADGLNAVARVGVAADHQGILCEPHVFRILKHWLKAGEPDPFYNPLNDYVILPTAFEIERHTEKNIQVTTLKEDWEIIASADTDTSDESKPADLPTMVGSLSLSSGDNLHPKEQAEATFVAHPQIEGMQHVEVRAISVAMVNKSGVAPSSSYHGLSNGIYLVQLHPWLASKR
ncbi:hypothetical protein Cni_G24500 [Canna indica]|uniref:Uncharacterized protein n=1 Tax=Canna indica TaxID=4628 RepID=A0AAQ3QLJ0_9LILI|nr:hypothetical protein Cni_G24500 [Canna indica]